MLRAIIIDDEKIGAESLMLLLKENCPHVEVLSVEHSAADGIAAIRKYLPEVIFLDIEMPKANGFEVIEQTKDIFYHTIFTTAYDKYGINALKANAVDYLLKPIDADELIAAVEKAEERIRQKTE